MPNLIKYLVSPTGAKLASLSAQTRHRLFHVGIGILMLLAMTASAAFARSSEESAKLGITAFASNCFSPFMTAEKADNLLGQIGVRFEFYDLDPFSSAAPSPVLGRAATPGTDRRCEVSFDGAYPDQAVTATVAALQREGIAEEAVVPNQFNKTEGTALLAARRLNPKKIAVVHVGTRPGPNGIETFMNVERLRLSKDQS